MRYFLSLGSNINAQKNIEFAVSELSKIFSDLESSTIHQTKAEGFEGRRLFKFCNIWHMPIFL